MQTTNPAPAPTTLADLDLSVLTPVTRELAPMMSIDLVAELVASATRLRDLGAPDCGTCRYRDPALTDGRPEIVRDSECPVHGIRANRVWWATPAALRDQRDPDRLPEIPRVTAAEAAADAQRDAWDRRDAARGGRR